MKKNKKKHKPINKHKKRQQHIVIGLLIVTIAGTIIGSLQAIL